MSVSHPLRIFAESRLHAYCRRSTEFPLIWLNQRPRERSQRALTRKMVCSNPIAARLSIRQRRVAIFSEIEPITGSPETKGFSRDYQNPPGEYPSCDPR